MVVELSHFFDLKESFIHPGRIIQIIPVGNAIKILVDSQPSLPGQFLVFLSLVYLFGYVPSLNSVSIKFVFFLGITHAL